MRRLRVYVAGPISRGDLAENVNRAGYAFRRLAGAGLAPLCPHWSVYSGGAVTDAYGNVTARATANGNGMTHGEWLAVDLAWVAVADAVLRLPGESAGADEEVRFAIMAGIPVFTSVEHVVKWAKANAA